jgi:hypothetical protein
MPIVMIQRMPGIRDSALLLNTFFWISMVMGLSLVSPGCSRRSLTQDANYSQLCALYVLV